MASLATLGAFWLPVDSNLRQVAGLRGNVLSLRWSPLLVYIRITYKWGNRYAVHLEKDSFCVHIADVLVSDSIHYASPFEFDRGGQVYGLRSCPFSFP